MVAWSLNIPRSPNVPATSGMTALRKTATSDGVPLTPPGTTVLTPGAPDVAELGSVARGASRWPGNSGPTSYDGQRAEEPPHHGCPPALPQEKG
jgi:hypothetical protein